ncbi:MAG: hypothetical protein ACREAO_08175, partial [Nitrososphaera sp.]
MEIWFIAVIAGAAAIGIVAVIIGVTASQPPATSIPDGPEPENNNTSIPNNSSGSPDPAPAPIIDDGPGPLPGDNDIFTAIPDLNPPQIRDQSLLIEKVVEGLSAPTSMAFVDERNLIVLQKDDGRVMLVADGALQEEPLATFDVENASERGLLGVAVNDRDVFI